MSQAAAFGGGKGSGDDNAGGKKGKAAATVKNSDDSLSSSSIGEESSDDNNEVDAPPSSTALDCMASLEASLPMKRGLSSSYDGKSKSFGNLSEIGIEDEDGKADLGKKEHITNKRRRLLISHQLHHPNKSLHAGANISQSSSMPSFPTLHKNDDDDDNNDDDEEGKKKGYDAEDENEEEKGDGK